MLNSGLDDYSDVYIPVKRIITVVGPGGDPTITQRCRNNKQAILKNCAQFTDCITEINNT